MKNRTLKGLLLLIIIVLFAFFLSSCEWLFSALAAPQGYVVDAKTGDPISGAVVKLTALESNGTDFTATTSTTGYYTFADVEYGRYELTAEKTSYTFTKQVVEVTGLAQNLPNVGGFVAQADTLSIVVFWDSGFEDVDAYLTYPTAEESWDYSLYRFYQPLGSNRDSMGPLAELLSDELGPLVEKDVDNNGAPSQPAGGPESFTIYWLPFEGPQNPVAQYIAVSNDPSRLPAGDYDYMGAMIYYLDAYNATNLSTDTVFGAAQDDALLTSLSPSSLAANPLVYVFYGNSQIARYTLPQYTDLKRVSVLRINLFLNSSREIYYQILPEIRRAGNPIDFKEITEDIVVIGGFSR